MPVLVAASMLTFIIALLLPGDLAYVILGDRATPIRPKVKPLELGPVNHSHYEAGICAACGPVD